MTVEYLRYSAVGFGDSPMAMKSVTATVKRNSKGLDHSELEYKLFEDRGLFTRGS